MRAMACGSAGAAAAGSAASSASSEAVDRQAVEPGAQGRLAPKAGQLPVSLDEHVLEQILGVVGGSRHARQQPEEPTGVRPVQGLERRRVALAAPARQFEVVGHG